jgi:hypothetical protein
MDLSVGAGVPSGLLAYKALGVLHRQSELNNRDVADIFTRFKKRSTATCLGMCILLESTSEGSNLTV